MKLALFYPNNFYASWYTLGGYKLALERLGHEVVLGEFPGNLGEQQVMANLQETMPKLEELNSCDAVISAFHEYSQPWLDKIYGFEAWSKLKVPVVARFDESMDRADLGLPKRWEELKRWANFFSFPAAQDAERFKGQWLPFGADISMFNWQSTEKVYPLGFVGSLYPVRLKYLQKLAEVLPDTLTFKCGPCVVQDLSGIREVESTELLAKNYRQIKVFFCLPPMSRLLVAKVFDVMACGTMVMYPKLPGDALKNMSLFEHGKHIVYYEGGYLKKNAAQVLHYLEHEDEREVIAAAGRDLVHEKFTLDKMLERLLDLVWNHQRVNLSNVMEFKKPLEATA